MVEASIGLREYVAVLVGARLMDLEKQFGVTLYNVGSVLENMMALGVPLTVRMAYEEGHKVEVNDNGEFVVTLVYDKAGTTINKDKPLAGSMSQSDVPSAVLNVAKMLLTSQTYPLIFKHGDTNMVYDFGNVVVYKGRMTLWGESSVMLREYR